MTLFIRLAIIAFPNPVKSGEVTEVKFQLLSAATAVCICTYMVAPNGSVCLNPSAPVVSLPSVIFIGILVVTLLSLVVRYIVPLRTMRSAILLP